MWEWILGAEGCKENGEGEGGKEEGGGEAGNEGKTSEDCLRAPLPARVKSSHFLRGDENYCLGGRMGALTPRPQTTFSNGFSVSCSRSKS